MSTDHPKGGAARRLLAGLVRRSGLPRDDIAFALQLVARQSQRRHLLRWIRSRRSDAARRAPIPWMVFDAADWVDGHLPRGARVFEYGSGESTRYWLARASQVVSVEHDPVYYAEHRNIVGTHEHLEYLLVEPERTGGGCRNPSDPGGYASADDRYAGCTFRAYVGIIDRYPDEHFDLVVIDGRARPSCIAHAAKKVAVGGLLVLDDSDRDYYLEKTAGVLRDFERTAFAGAKPGLSWFSETSVSVRKA